MEGVDVWLLLLIQHATQGKQDTSRQREVLLNGLARLSSEQPLLCISTT